MTFFSTGFDPYRKWLGIPEHRRPPTYYDILGVTRGENDDDAIRSAAQQRRAFIQSKQGEGHDKEVAKILQEIDESVACLLVPTSKNEYDRRIGITGKRKGKEKNHPLPPWFDYFPVRIYGEGSGLISSLIAVVAVIGTAFGLMLWFSFQMPWGKISQQTQTASVPSLSANNDQGQKAAPPPNQQSTLGNDEGRVGESVQRETEVVEPNEHLVGSTTFRGHSYKVFRETGLDWTTAKKRCESMGGHLVTISDEQESKFVVDLASKTIGDINNKGIWLGATDEQNEGQWKWIDGTPFSFTNWNQGQGNNGNRNENYLLLLLYFRGPQGKEFRGWADQPMAGKIHVIYYACEWESIEPQNAKPDEPGLQNDSLALRSFDPSRSNGGSKPDIANTIDKGWKSLFDGSTLTGWRASGSPAIWRVEDGCIVCNGERGYLFYTGSHQPAKDFHLKCEIRTTAGSNSGIYFHTKYQEIGIPRFGLECQIATNLNRDIWKSSSLYGIAKVVSSPIQDEVWYEQEIIVEGKRVVLKVNGEVIVDYVEPQNQTAFSSEFERLLGEGTFALQSNSPNSKTYFRNIRVEMIKY